MFIADFSYVNVPLEDWWAGMHIKPKGDSPPKLFEPFNFYVKQAPDHSFDIFHIPSHIMFQAGLAAGFGHIEHKPQYCDPAVKDHSDIRRYIDTLDHDDYLMKFKFSKK
jgi:hypothetical protein